MEAEKIAQEMFLAKKKEYDAENRRNQEMEELYHRIDMLEHGADPGNGRQKEKRGWFTGKKSKTGAWYITTAFQQKFSSSKGFRYQHIYDAEQSFIIPARCDCNGCEVWSV